MEFVLSDVPEQKNADPDPRKHKDWPGLLHWALRQDHYKSRCSPWEKREHCHWRDDVHVFPKDCIGKNVNIATGVTIGQENRGKRKGCPTIGDRVWIGTNAVLVGNINIGSDVLIAPLSYVNFDVPDHSIVLGNPARIISRENATASYIEKLVT